MHLRGLKRIATSDSQYSVTASPETKAKAYCVDAQEDDAAASISCFHQNEPGPTHVNMVSNMFHADSKSQPLQYS